MYTYMYLHFLTSCNRSHIPAKKQNQSTNGPVNAHLISDLGYLYDVQQMLREPRIPSVTHLVKYINQFPGFREAVIISKESITVTFFYMKALVAKFDLATK